MTPSSSTRIGPYEILFAIGAGGMGEVYEARDTKLDRHVAIKILPDVFVSEPERVDRFRREAKTLASLNHPNIAGIYGLEEARDVTALVMELVEGEDLSERIRRGAIPLDEALPIAEQIALALEAAHERGIIHRDLKPANIKLRPDGVAKVLDFGLAKLTEPAGIPSGSTTRAITDSPTLTSPAMMTGVGVLLGTAAYMSPEQAKGREADKRSDVWAFGCVLYEMLTGQRAFEGEDVADTLAAVLKGGPDWHRLPPDTPPHIRLLIQRCLAKHRRERVADISVALFVMRESAHLAPSVVAGAERRTVQGPLWRRLLVPVAAAILAGATVGTIVWRDMRPPAPRTTRFAIAETGPTALALDQVSIDLAITRDGTQIVYKGRGTGTDDDQFFVRALDELVPTPFTGLGRPKAPFLSPDGQWVGFVDISSATALRKVAISGGPHVLLCELDGASAGATWGEDESIIFATQLPSTGLQRVSSAGGDPTVLTTPDRERGQADHLWPQFLPGSRAVLFTITSTTGGIDAAQVAVLDLRSGTSKILIRGGSQAQYVASGHLVYAAAGTLRAIAFDPERLEASGPAVPVLPGVVTLPNGTAEFDIARDGTLIYASGGAGAARPRTLMWVDRQGREEPIKGAPARSYVVPRISPDGTRVALGIRDQQNDIWVWDFARETLTRVTFDPGFDDAPVWMPDGRRFVFSSFAGGTAGSLFWQAADGTGSAKRLTQGSNLERPSAVSPDGTRVLFWGGRGATRADVMMLTLENDPRIEPLIQSPFVERNGVISPDGRWLAYESNQAGEFQIFVRPFPDVHSGLSHVSTGVQPVWARNGEELFYIGPNGALMSVRVGRGATWTAGIPTTLIDGSYFRGTGNDVRTYDVSSDDQRFLMIKEGGTGLAPGPTSIVVVQNWHEELKRLVPPN